MVCVAICLCAVIRWLCQPNMQSHVFPNMYHVAKHGIYTGDAAQLADDDGGTGGDDHRYASLRLACRCSAMRFTGTRIAGDDDGRRCHAHGLL